jgi:hypothetical protein
MLRRLSADGAGGEPTKPETGLRSYRIGGQKLTGKAFPAVVFLRDGD